MWRAECVGALEEKKWVCVSEGNFELECVCVETGVCVCVENGVWRERWICVCAWMKRLGLWKRQEDEEKRCRAV